jgi:hypothetical protein
VGEVAAPDSNLDRRLVLNAGMHRTFSRLICTAFVAALALPGVASARIIEVGAIGTPPVASCPTSPCEVISRTTAYQFRVGAKRGVFVAPADGRIVAWSITLGAPGKKQRAFFEENLGGASQAGISVLRPGKRYFGRVTAASPLQALTPYFGQTVQFPLTTSLDVKKGNIVALSVPTWAPALGLGLGRDHSWKASRQKTACDDTQTQSVQLDVTDLAQYKCAYRTARLSYSATLITTPVPPEPPKKPKPKP